MILEHRAYTLLPGNAEAFWQSQIDRGFDLVKPVFETTIGYFSSLSGPVDEIVHIYRFENQQDWHQRYFSLYGMDALDPYFRTVRALMTRQTNAFYRPTPIAELGPLWNDTNDWRPGDTPVADCLANPDLIVEQQMLTLKPGGIPAFYKAYGEHVGDADGPLRERLIGVFQSLVGVQHQILSYWWFDNLDDARARRAAVNETAGWQAFEAAIRPLTASLESTFLAPSPVAIMVPLLAAG
jgi:hypothetical protein